MNQTGTPTPDPVMLLSPDANHACLGALPAKKTALFNLSSLSVCLLTKIAFHCTHRQNRILGGSDKTTHAILLPVMRQRAQEAALVIQKFWRSRCRLFSTKVLVKQFLRVTRLSHEGMQGMR